MSAARVTFNSVGRREIRLEDQPELIQRDIPDGCKIVKFLVPAPGLLEFRLGAPHLLVLHLELDLVNLELVDQALLLVLRKIPEQISLPQRGYFVFGLLAEFFFRIRGLFHRENAFTLHASMFPFSPPPP